MNELTRDAGGGSTPRPDPTVLTTQQLNREIQAARETTDILIDGLREILDEKFASIDQQLTLIEQQRVEQKADTKAAVDAALTAQKEAVKEQTIASDRAIAKSESSTTKQIDQLGETLAASIQAVTVALSDLKDRVGKIEAVKQGGHDTLLGVYALVGVIVVVLGLVLSVYVASTG